MNLKKALKEKNKLTGKINSLSEKLRKYNITAEGQKPIYNVKELYDELIRITDEMIALKTRIHIANKPVYDKIFRLSELKNLAKQLQYMRCEPYRETGGMTVIAYEPVITVQERDTLTEAIENEIESIQDELDAFNQQTII